MTLAMSHREGERLVLDCVARAKGSVLSGRVVERVRGGR